MWLEYWKACLHSVAESVYKVSIRFETLCWLSISIFFTKGGGIFWKVGWNELNGGCWKFPEGFGWRIGVLGRNCICWKGNPWGGCCCCRNWFPNAKFVFGWFAKLLSGGFLIGWAAWKVCGRIGGGRMVFSGWTGGSVGLGWSILSVTTIGFCCSEIGWRFSGSYLCNGVWVLKASCRWNDRFRH